MLGPLMMGYVNLQKAASDSVLVVERGEGIRLFDDRGRSYIDASSGFYCVSLGYSEPALIEAATKQLEKLPHYAISMQRTSAPALELAQKLADISPIKDAHVCFSNSGSEAIDFALKFTRHGNAARGRPGKRLTFSRVNSYHGLTFRGHPHSLTLDENVDLGLPVDEVIKLTQPDFDLNAEPGESEVEFTDRLVDELEGAIAAYGAENIATFLGEPVSVSAGCSIPPDGYWPRIVKILERNDIDCLIDEVVTGFGRLGHFFAARDEFDVTPSLMTCAKGLTSAYQPLGALIMNDEFFHGLEEASAAAGVLPHTSTTGGNPVSCAVALRTIEIMEERDIIGHVQRTSPYLKEKLETLCDHELVSHVKLNGFLGYVQLRPPQTNRFGVEGGLAPLVLERGYERGVLTRPRGNRSIFAPPLITTAEEIDEIVDRYRLCLDDVLASL